MLDERVRVVLAWAELEGGELDRVVGLPAELVPDGARWGPLG